MKRSKRYKQRKVWIKQEKRIVRLLFQKGLIKKDFCKELYWEAFRYVGKSPKGKHRKYPNLIYYPEIFFSTTDYWGEVDEWSITSKVLEEFYWSQVHIEWEDGWPKSLFKHFKREDFIKYLKTLRTVQYGSKHINPVLKRTFE